VQKNNFSYADGASNNHSAVGSAEHRHGFYKGTPQDSPLATRQGVGREDTSLIDVRISKS
jgi:hypothetical protein